MTRFRRSEAVSSATGRRIYGKICTTNKRNPGRVLAGPQPRFLATNPHYRKGA